jgi:hypothetical protein
MASQKSVEYYKKLQLYGVYTACIPIIVCIVVFFCLYAVWAYFDIDPLDDSLSGDVTPTFTSHQELGLKITQVLLPVFGLIFFSIRYLLPIGLVVCLYAYFQAKRMEKNAT